MTDNSTKSVSQKKVLDDPNFVGREEAIAILTNLLNQRSSRICQIVAPGGQGKTTFARKYLESKKFKPILEFTIAKETKDIASVESWLEENLRDLGVQPGREFSISLKRFKQKLQSQPIGILIDNLEPALDASGQFIEQHRSYVELLQALNDPSLKSLTLITSRERLSEGLDILPYSLPKLTVEAWREYWHSQQINPDITLLTEIHKAYGGNALAMKLLSNLINNDYQGDMVAYWRDNKTEDNLIVETAVANLIKEQFERLQKNINQNINRDAYNLLCRLGCYRYQDVPTVPEAGLLCLLWDVAENQHKRIIKVLKDRALVEFNKDSDYWLHPVIREVAIERLRKSKDCEKANTQAAEFWTKKVKTVETVEKALTAFEAYYHYIEIQDFKKAFGIFLHRRPCESPWYMEEDGEVLQNTYRKLGLHEKMISSITDVLEKLTSNNIEINQDELSISNKLLGDLYWIKGDIKSALEYNKIAYDHVNEFFENEKNQNNWIARRNYFAVRIAKTVFKFDLLELDELIDPLEKLIEEVERIEKENYENYEKFYNFKVEAFFCLAFIYSSLDNDEKSNDYLTKIDLENDLENDREKLSEWCRPHLFLFLGYTLKNLGKFEEAKKMYQKVDEVTTDYYLQVKGKALTGLAELYRKNDIEKALTHHQKSIKKLKEIGAKCDLAEAYFQKALTYQQIEKKVKVCQLSQDNSKVYFDKAKDLWGEKQIDAPNQIKRVEKAMNSEH